MYTYGSHCCAFICGAWRSANNKLRVAIACSRLLGVVSAIKLHRCVVYYVYEPKILVRRALAGTSLTIHPPATEQDSAVLFPQRRHLPGQVRPKGIATYQPTQSQHPVAAPWAATRVAPLSARGRHRSNLPMVCHHPVAALRKLPAPVATPSVHHHLSDQLHMVWLHNVVRTTLRRPGTKTLPPWQRLCTTSQSPPAQQHPRTC